MFDPQESMGADPREQARTQVLCWLLDEVFDAEEDLLELMARPGAFVGWRRERLRAFCERVGEGLGQELESVHRASEIAYSLAPLAIANRRKS